ncbi:MAG: N-acetylglucosamine-6-phosphate deacetylase [Oscillospiraceae bacterium]|jgi:N-acetylglucosamine-6-phosphate deacetylase|nr:N-acetylglucosamine-6-phosphate deacetylase [Oscillospiraceae bacterium]
MKAIRNGRILMPDGQVEGRALLFDETIIGLVNPDDLPSDAEIIDAGGLFVSPGLVDIHIHGYGGADASDGDADGIRQMAAGIAQNGVTAWCPTTMTVPQEKLRAVFTQMRALREASRAPGWQGAEILGVHAEGPFINPSRKGAQKADNILPPDADFLRPYADILRVVTLAPEMPGALDCIRIIAGETTILISMGHTDASYEQAMAAIAAGLHHATHTFNAMTGLSHRAPGVVGAALTAPITAELIADTFHVHPGLFPLMLRAKGDQLILITDCTRAGGMADGEYDLGGQPIFVKGIECRLSDGTIAGSVLKLNHAVTNLAKHAALPLYEAVRYASHSPAKAIGEANKGTLEPGMDADIVLMDVDCEVSRTIVRGRTVYQRKR